MHLQRSEGPNDLGGTSGDCEEDVSSSVLLFITSFFASAVEAVEALTIVLAVGVVGAIAKDLFPFLVGAAAIRCEAEPDGGTGPGSDFEAVVQRSLRPGEGRVDGRCPVHDVVADSVLREGCAFDAPEARCIRLVVAKMQRGITVAAQHVAA
jgi:hypothetical protein